MRYADVTSALRWPLPSVLDTCCVRTGLKYQLELGAEPASIAYARSGKIRLFMELETLHETIEKLSKFAGDLGVPVSQLREMFNGWLPFIRVVELPPWLRELDPRALAVRQLDSDDYPAAALTALLSRCVILTHDAKHFRPLGVKAPGQGTAAVTAVVEIAQGELEVQALMLIPTFPALLVGGTAKWAIDSHGLVGLLGLIVVTAGGVALYRRQSSATKERIKGAAVDIGKVWLEEGAARIADLKDARGDLVACVVPEPSPRSWESAAIRQLAVSGESMSAQQLRDLLEPRPSVVALRKFLHANKRGVFNEVRPGSFELGRRYTIRSQQ